MNIYFSSRDIPSISQLPLTERLALIQQAQNKLTGPEKLLLNFLKLAVLLPIFILIFRSTAALATSAATQFYNCWKTTIRLLCLITSAIHLKKR